MQNIFRFSLLFIWCTFIFATCSKTSSGGNPPPTPPVDDKSVPVEYWITKPDSTVLLQKQAASLSFNSLSNDYTVIDVDSSQQLQPIEGFGFTLTGGSAYVINKMTPAAKAALLKEIYTTENNGIGVSYIRVSIGASDLNAEAFTYDDLADGETDLNLNKFSLEKDKTDFIPVLKEVLQLNPGLPVLATPWSAPAWMKDNNSLKGGSLKPEYYSVYAQYFVRYIQAMKAEGITISAITPQNEPLHPGNNPSMYMTAEQQTVFIRDHLGPAFRNAGITTKIIVYDHNCDRPDYPLTILNDAAAREFVHGSAFHLYAGDIKVLSDVHAAYPDKALYFTEQYTGSEGQFSGDLQWALKNIIIGSTRNWSRVALEWNLANDPQFGPHTPGGCTTCKGAVTIDGNSFKRNVAYYIVAHASKFVPSGSKRITSNVSGSIQNVAFLRPDGKKVLIVLNDSQNTANFRIRFKGQWATTSLIGGAVATYIW
ncbi:glycoside hydrolase family 30 protein [Flavihumibacter solisilvae]|uniref:Glucosylceramidase n=1 Tax=Flavihumibacter solisilvae TaxID=1349421 RepID=A0A0C1L512_9BACT|nr:glycoside hydrolase family 30 beta sandwich domain-containing protein [Flavihumibacter solisilvae]KIC95202.1 glucosylceramidase [Flavihumibacter solisilvae]